MAKKSLDECKKDYEFINYCASYSDVEIVAGKGSHTKVKTPHGSTVIPKGELRTGTRLAIIKQLALLGITLFLIGYFLIQYKMI